ncbi:MAG TPA: Uma2 family endonuclease [Acidobacteriaceae bacterium]|nr:Uma2 family endonuclease [Acidobacteriaceae bacterium]
MATAPKVPDELPNQEPRRVPMEVYLRCSDWEPDAEYVDGEIEERPVGEYDHSSWQAAIQKWFWQHQTEWNIRTLPELRVQVSATRFRVPDVTILDRNQPREPIITHPPVAVFEVLSPEDRHTRLTRKLTDYEAMGIPQIWVINPDGPVFQRFHSGHLTTSAIFDEPARGIHFEMREIEALLD